MAERDPEISRLEARIAELEATPSARDLGWLKNSNSFKIAERMTRPQTQRNGRIAVAIIWGIFILTIIIGIVRDH